MNGRVRILGVAVDPVTMAEAEALVVSWANGGTGGGLSEAAPGMGGPGEGACGGPVPPRRARIVLTPNPEIIMAARRDPELAAALEAADLSLADGIGVVWAGRVLGRPVPERVTGMDLLERILGRLAERGGSAYFLGGRPGVAEQAAARAAARWPGLRVAGWHHGYFSPGEEEGVVAEVAAAGADLLVCGMGFPRDQKWLWRQRDRLGVRVAMGVGGALDVLAGRVRRAPAGWRRLHLEWFYRLLTQPWRWRRMLALPRFCVAVLAEARARRSGAW